MKATPFSAHRAAGRNLAEFPSTLAFPPEARLQRLLLEHDVFDRHIRQPEYVGRAFTSNSLDACLDYAAATNAVLRHTQLMAPTFRSRKLCQVEMKPGDERNLALSASTFFLNVGRIAV